MAMVHQQIQDNAETHENMVTKCWGNIKAEVEKTSDNNKRNRICLFYCISKYVFIYGIFLLPGDPLRG